MSTNQFRNSYINIIKLLFMLLLLSCAFDSVLANLIQCPPGCCISTDQTAFIQDSSHSQPNSCPIGCQLC